jgi:hypothetical protein
MKKFALILLLACGSLACGSARVQGTEASTDAGSDSQGECTKAPGGVSEDAFCIREVSGVIQSSDGSALDKIPVSVCGLACFAASTDATGAFRIRVGAKLPPRGYVLSAYGRPNYAGVYLRLPEPPSEMVMFPALRLPRLSNDETFLPEDGSPAAIRTVGPLAFEIAAGTTWELDLEDSVAGPEGRRIRYAAVSNTDAPPFASDAALVFAFAPFKAKADKPFRVTVETRNLVSGTAVDFIVMQDDVTSADNTGGLGKVVAKGHITADGKRAEMDPGEGIRTLTWLAIRAAK